MFNSLNPFKKREYVPNQHIGETKKMGILDDDYTIAERKRKELENDEKVETFTDKDGRVYPLSELNGRSEILVDLAKESLEDEALRNERLKEADERDIQLPKEEDYPERNHNALLPEHSRIPKSRELAKSNGLYNIHNPKLNENSPGNRKENFRKSRLNEEKTKWDVHKESPDDIEYDPIGLPDLSKDEE